LQALGYLKRLTLTISQKQYGVISQHTFIYYKTVYNKKVPLPESFPKGCTLMGNIIVLLGMCIGVAHQWWNGWSQYLSQKVW